MFIASVLALAARCATQALAIAYQCQSIGLFSVNNEPHGNCFVLYQALLLHDLNAKQSRRSHSTRRREQGVLLWRGWTMELSIGRRCLCRSVDMSAGAAEGFRHSSMYKLGVRCDLLNESLEAALTVWIPWWIVYSTIPIPLQLTSQAYSLSNEARSMDRFCSGEAFCATVNGHKVRFSCTIRPIKVYCHQ